MRTDLSHQSFLSLSWLVVEMMVVSTLCSQAHAFRSPTASLVGKVSKFGMLRTRTPSPLKVLAEPLSTLHQSSDDKMVLDPLIVCGPSGVGKGTIIAKFMEELGGNNHFAFTVSHTTRSPRVGEIDGVHYHFVPLDTMKEAIRNNEFLEHAEVHGNYYGTSWSSLKDVQLKGKRCLLDIDVQGVKNIKRMESDGLQPKYIFITPPSLEVLEQRLVGRGTESAESLARRTANARSEVEYGLQQENFDAVVVNGDLTEACHEFSRLVKKMYNI